MNGRRIDGENPRARGTNPRAHARNPRATGTNPHPGKAERTGQWRAAFRRLERMTPERRHEILRQLEHLENTGGLPAEALTALRRLRAPQPT